MQYFLRKNVSKIIHVNFLKLHLFYDIKIFFIKMVNKFNKTEVNAKNMCLITNIQVQNGSSKMIHINAYEDR